MAYSSVDEIKTLEYPLSVQKRVGMYMGDQAKNSETPGQANVAVREIVDNAITESTKGYADYVKITFHKDGFVSCLDNGRGLPVDVDKKTGKNGIIKTMAELHSGGNFDNKVGGRQGPGLNGVGGACVNALSARFDVSVYRKNTRYNLSFKNGLPGFFSDKDDSENSKFTSNDKIKRTNNAKDNPFEHGTLIRFKLNKDYFADCENIIVDDIIDRMRYTVYLVPGLTIDIVDETRSEEDGGGEYHFVNEGNIEGMLDFITTGEPALKAKKDEGYASKGIFGISTKAKYKEKYVDVTSGKSEVTYRDNVIPIEVAFRFNDNETKDIRSFANTIQTQLGGSHQQALEEALVDTFGKLAKRS